MDKAENIISDLFGEKIVKGMPVISGALKNWQSIVIDKRLADHCKLEDIAGHQLIVSFDHQGWIQVFKMHQKQIIRNVNRHLGNKSISSVRMIMKGDLKSYQEKKINVYPFIEEQKKEVIPESNNIERIKDPELKDQLEKLKKMLQGK